MTLAVQFAMAGEAQTLLRLGSFRPLEAKSPYGFQLFEDASRGVVVGYAGEHPRFKVDAIGSVAAALLADHLLERFEVSRLINAGTAGGFASRGGAVGDVYLGAEKVVFHDRRIQLEGFEAMGKGHFPVESDVRLAQKLGFKVGVVSTGDSLDCTDEDLRQMVSLGASVKEMEAASIAWVCERRGVPLVLLKAITDLVDHHEATSAQFLKNYDLAVDRLGVSVEQLIAHYTVNP